MTTKLPSDVTMTIGATPVGSGDIEQLVTTTETPGGFASCSFSACGTLRPELADIIRIHNSTYGAYGFIGRVSAIHKKGSTYDITATRSTRDKTYTVNTVPVSPDHPGGQTSERIYQAGTQLYVILTDALSITPDIFDGGIVNPGLQLIANSQDVGGFTAEQVWNYISSLIGNLATPLLWHIRGVAGQQVVVIDYQDIAARYFVELSEDQIEEQFSLEAIVNEAAVSYGKGQIAFTDGGLGVLPIDRTKFENASHIGVTRIGEAKALADAYVARYNQFRSINDVLTVKCEDTVRVVPPAHTEAVDDWPHYLIESGRGIQLLNRPADQAPYNLNLKYITGTSYDWDTEELVVRGGEIRSLDSTIQQTVDYNVNRLFNGPYNGPPGGSHPLADADLLPKVGPEVDATVPPSTTYGVPAFKAAQEGEENLPHDKAIDPNIIADEGLEANIIFNPASAGFQAAIRVVPGSFNQYRLLLGNSAGLVNATVVAELYKVLPPPAGGTQLLLAVASLGNRDRTAPIAPAIILSRGDYYMIKVTTTAATATWGALSLHAKKQFPGLKS